MAQCGGLDCMLNRLTGIKDFKQGRHLLTVSLSYRKVFARHIRVCVFKAFECFLTVLPYRKGPLSKAPSSATAGCTAAPLVEQTSFSVIVPVASFFFLIPLLNSSAKSLTGLGPCLLAWLFSAWQNLTGKSISLQRFTFVELSPCPSPQKILGSELDCRQLFVPAHSCHVSREYFVGCTLFFGRCC